MDDGCSVYRALLAAGMPPERIVIVGDSAGGGLAMSILLALRDEGVPMPAAVVLISPFADLAGAGESLRTKAARDPVLDAIAVARVAERYIPQLAPTDPRVSSVYASLEGFPPMLIHVGTDEVLLSDAQRLAQRAQAAGVPVILHEWEGMWHCFALNPALPESQAALKSIADFVQERM
jgi:acetyl esterase/lipase